VDAGSVAAENCIRHRKVVPPRLLEKNYHLTGEHVVWRVHNVRNVKCF